MAQASETIRTKGRWSKILGIAAAALLVLLVALYFVGTSSAFLKAMVLPKVGASMGSDITASDIELSPFKRVVLRDLKVTPKGGQPLVYAKAVSVEYNLGAILKGSMNFDEILVTEPVVTVVETPAGARNYEPILEAQVQESGADSEQPTDSVMKMQIKRLSVTGGTLVYTKQHAGGKQDASQVTQFSLDLQNVGNNAAGKAAFSGLFDVANNPPAPASNGSMRGKMNGQYDFTLDAELMPTSIKGMGKFAVQAGSGNFQEFADFSAELIADVTPAELRQVTLSLRQGDTSLGEMRLHGPFSLEKMEGEIAAELLGVGHKAFDLAGAPYGFTFGDTALRSTNWFSLSQTGQVAKVRGQVDLAKFQAIRTNQPTPPLDLKATYDSTVDMTKSTALLRVLDITGVQQGREILKGGLTSPMTVSWGGASNAVPDSSWTLALTQVDLANWKAFAGDFASGGLVNGEMKLTSSHAGQVLLFDLAGRGKDLTVIADSNSLSQVDVTISASGSATNLDRFNLPALKFDLLRAGQPVLNASGSGIYNAAAEAADFRIEGSAVLDRLIAMAPQTGMSLSSGSARMNARVTQNMPQVETNDMRAFWATTNAYPHMVARTISGDFAITNMSGIVSSNRLEQFAAAAELDVAMDDREIKIRRMAGKLFGAEKPGGAFDVSGTYAPSNSATRLAVQLSGINEDGLRPFAGSMLDGKELVSVLIDGDANIQYAPEGDSAIQGSLSVTNLVVHENGKALTPEPLALGAHVDTTIAKGIMEIRDALLVLTPTPRATNMVNLSGRIDMSATNFTQGNVKLSASSLDLTHYYDVFSSTQVVSSTPSPMPTGTAGSDTAASPTPGVESELEPVSLPLTNFVVEAAVGQVYLHEMEVTNFEGLLKIDGSRILIQPLELALNGGPASGAMDIDMSMPGYRYGLSFKAGPVPLAPLVNSFQPERSGQIGGTFSGHMKLEGAGTTSSSMYRNLKGDFDFGSTNLNLAIPSLRSPLMKTVINVVGVVPEILKNPTSALGTLTGALFKPQTASSGGLVNEIMQSPVDVIKGKGVIGGGRLEIQDSLLQSPAFQASAKGSVAFNPIFTNSALNLPIAVALKRPLAASLNMVPAGTPTNVAYVKLPDYVTIKGTVGQPKSDINKLALLGTVMQQVGSGIPGVDPKTGGLLRNLGEVLTGTGTNAAAGTNQSQQGNLLQGLGNILSGQSTNQISEGNTNRQSRSQRTLQGLGGLLNAALGTNASPAGTNSTETNQAPVGSLLDQLLSPRK